MTELKTKPNDVSVHDFLSSVPDEAKRADSLKLLELFTRVTNEHAKMWGSSIVGFGMYHYKSERSSQEGDWPLTAFSPRKQSLTLYVLQSGGTYDDLLEHLGKHTTGKGCLYIKRLADVDITVLEQLIARSFVDAKKNFS